jgi:hypothetical protein
VLHRVAMDKVFQCAVVFVYACTATVGSDMALNQKGDNENRFPRLQASNLEKRSFNLPEDFEGTHNLLLVAFQREQQEQVDTWLREMKRFENVDPGLHYYELPTIQSPNRLVRWFIDTGMRRGIPDQKARARTITLYIDKQPFLEALGIPEEKRIYCFLVDRTGRILWRDEGIFDESKAAGLKESLQELMKPISGNLGGSERSGSGATRER